MAKMKKETSYISFDNLKNELFKPENLVKDFDNYYGHIRENSEGEIEKVERLQDHIEKVNDYFLRIIETHNLEKSIDEHINKIKNIFKDSGKGAEFIKILFFETINFHDIGKVNPNFQAVIMKNKKFNKENNSLGTNHSILSVYLFYAYMVKKLYKCFADSEDRVYAYVLVLLFSVLIRKHHSSEISNPFYYFEYLDNKNRFFEDIEMDNLIKFLKVSKIIENIESDKDKKKIIKKLIKGIYKIDLSQFKERFINRLFENLDSFPIYSLLKLDFSLLTVSDYLATTSFMLDTEIPIEGIIDETLRENIYNRFYKSTEWNRRLIKKDGSEKPKDFVDLGERNNDSLNELRYKMLYEIRETLNKNISNNLFFLEAPTGAGKTNISFMAVAELLKHRKKLNRVFYVFPFTTLITQTKESIVEVFGLKEKDYIELHSRADFKDNEKNYGRRWKNFIDYQFVNYPITLLTHIRFFDIIKSNKKDDNYLYHKLANSIVIIDEIQAYSPRHWDKIYYFIKNVSKSFNTVFIIMSATLPDLSKIKLNNKIDFSQFVRLNKHKDEYFKNSNFSKRVEFEFIDDIKDLKTLKEKIKEKAKEYDKNSHWVLTEFIYKKSASEFFKIINEDKYFKNYKKYLLSGTILEPIRKKIINELKTKRENKGYRKVILISTQVVEAGVDLDFDIGFKDTSIIDSDEQLAGRINRNALRSNCKVYLFDYDRKDIIYGSDFRYKIQKQKFDFEEYRNYLLNKDFNSFYNNVIDYINDLNNRESISNFDDYEEKLKKLNFPCVHNEFKLIDQDTISVFVNVEYDLNKYNITINKDFAFLVDENKLKGEKVWKKYCEIIENKDANFAKKRENIIKIQALMSNFVFSIFRPSTLTEEIKNCGKEKYGYLYIEDTKDIYSLESGLDEKKLQQSSIWVV